MAQSDSRLIVHVLFRLQTGGLENGLVNIINGLAEGEYRHAILCIDSFTDFKDRIEPDDVPVIAINKKPGRDVAATFRILRELRRLKPDIIHTRNLAALDALLPAFLARVPFRIHSEHGRDVDDLDGTNRKHQLLRRLHRPLIHRYIAVSPDLAAYLNKTVGVALSRIDQIYNGVDTKRFAPSISKDDKCRDLLNFSSGAFLVGTVGRLDFVKDHSNLIRAFSLMLARRPELRGSVKMAIVGDGPARETVEAELSAQGLTDDCWLPGSRTDVADVLRTIDVFALPSLAEGISNTILEAMASGLAVVATEVGGNSQLIQHQTNGQLVPASDPEALSIAVEHFVCDENARRNSGAAGRQIAQSNFSIERMIENYASVYGMCR